ncbi:MAG: 23S rRNA (guanosine(2251)-2'-O)-methyltransferase RlmB [Desulfobacterales bacterium]|jgi:23S rRNA (guanosine2251-2'-O)-methyltransferase
MSGGSKNREILYGMHPVLEALRAGRRQIMEVCIDAGSRGTRFSPVVEEARRRRVPVRELTDRQLLAEVRAPNHQGVIARVGPYPYAPEPRSYRLVDHAPIWLLLDGVVDPRNLGAMLRTALCAGAVGVVIAKDRAAPATPAVSRASAGALEHVQLVRVTNMHRTIEAMKSDGLWIAGLDADGDRPLYAADLSGPLGLVVGGEGRGLRPLVRRSCDFLLRIPQSGPVDSLNASIAAAVALYEAVRQRAPAARK